MPYNLRGVITYLLFLMLMVHILFKATYDAPKPNQQTYSALEEVNMITQGICTVTDLFNFAYTHRPWQRSHKKKVPITGQHQTNTSSTCKYKTNGFITFPLGKLSTFVVLLYWIVPLLSNIVMPPSQDRPHVTCISNCYVVLN